jgi:NADH-quinone oxidoreductase subunit G
MSDDKPMVTLSINGEEVQAPQGTLVIEAARAAGHKVPSFCYHPGLPPDGNCRMCICDVRTWNPRTEEHMAARRPVVTCKTEVADKMAVITESPEVSQIRASVMEFLLINHPIDCPICDKAGECMLQDHYMSYDQTRSELRDEKVHKPRLVHFSDRIVYNAERCIMCSRCVRFTTHVTESHELGIVNRGDRTFVDVPEGGGLHNNYQDCVSDICPVGALTKTRFRFKRRVWNLKHVDSVCGGCSRGCNTVVDHDRVAMYRVMPRHNAQVNGYWMCDEGRDLIDGFDKDRITEAGIDGETATWAEALERCATVLGTAREAPDSVAILASAWASNEAAAAARKLAGDLGIPEANLAVKTDRVSGFEADDILHTDDHNPNRRGVTDAGFEGEVDEILGRVSSGAIKTLVLWGGGLHHHLDGAEPAELLGKLDSLIYLGLTSDPAGDLAQVVLPLATSFESRGSWTNVDGIPSAFGAALAPPGQARSAFRAWCDLASATGQEALAEDEESAARQLGHPVFERPLNPAGALFRHASMVRRP